VGRLTKQKGYDLLIEAAAIAINKFPALYFIIIGDGEEASLLRNRAEELEISHRIVFTGSRSDVDTLLTAMDLFVCSSRWEGLSTVLMEAMAVGIPILATDLPGNRELLQPGVSGWFVPVENSSELAAGIIKAVQNPDKSKEFAKIAKIKVDSFGMEEIARLHTRLYKLIRANKDRNNWINHQYADEEINRQIGSS
jgi:glycosyltransferase involved in cell wall biosynthesis